MPNVTARKTTMFSTDINSIEKIKLDLFELKPYDSLLKTYMFFNSELEKYFEEDGSPKDAYFCEVNCPICDEAKTERVCTIDNFSYDRCKKCSAIYNKKMLKNEVLEDMYSSGIYIEYFKTLVLRSQKLRKERLERRKVAQISSFFSAPGKILDVGCGSGSLLKECQEVGWEVYGLDPSEEAVKTAKKKYDLAIDLCTFEQYETHEKFDCVVFIGLEHLQDPMGGLDKASKLLKDKGIIFFEAPSADSFLMNYLKKYPTGLTRYIEAGRHYLFFSRKSVDFISEKFDLKLEHIESNGLDLQTILFDEFEPKTTKNIVNMQDTLNDLLLGDHYRVFLRKNN
jgi:2-polyprenyl-3-methyl-5-hydroxy-6-metoxy-1,4-benzoquinol methylase